MILWSFEFINGEFTLALGHWVVFGVEDGDNLGPQRISRTNDPKPIQSNFPGIDSSVRRLFHPWTSFVDLSMHRVISNLFSTHPCLSASAVEGSTILYVITCLHSRSVSLSRRNKPATRFIIITSSCIDV